MIDRGQRIIHMVRSKITKKYLLYKEAEFKIAAPLQPIYDLRRYLDAIRVIVRKKRI
jgi:hypothetical protein